MTNRIMLCANANENTVSIRTVSARMKSPQHFYICYEEFDRLRDEGRIISNDIRSFVKLRLDEKHDRIWRSGRAWVQDHQILAGLHRQDGVPHQLGWHGFGLVRSGFLARSAA